MHNRTVKGLTTVVWHQVSSQNCERVNYCYMASGFISELMGLLLLYGIRFRLRELTTVIWHQVSSQNCDGFTAVIWMGLLLLYGIRFCLRTEG